MADSSATASVLIAATQSVAKVYVIGAIGFLAVKCTFPVPRASPLLPSSAVGILARFGFNALVIPLIYSTTARSVSPASLGSYWFVLLGAVVVLAISYVIPTVLSWCIKIANPHDYCSLRVAATFPNVVALPILIFPALCEYSFVYRDLASGATAGVSDEGLREQCVATSNTIVFVYFFAWSLAFWSIGYPQLLMAARRNIREPSETDLAEIESSTVGTAPETSDRAKASPGVGADVSDENTEQLAAVRVGEATNPAPGPSDSGQPTFIQALRSTALVQAIVRTFTSPGFLALAAGFCTGCIAPLKSALFDAGGALRFLGSSLETLGVASNSISTMVVAASLVPASRTAMSPSASRAALSPSSEPRDDTAATLRTDEDVCQDHQDSEAPATPTASPCTVRECADLIETDENPIMSDPNFGPYRRRMRRSSQFVQRTIRRQSARLVEALPLRSSPELRRLLIWFTLSRLILAPAVVVAMLISLDCTTSVLSSVPPLAKLVVIFNASVPGALIVVVLLKAQPHLSDTAAAISQVYLPTYLIAIFTMAGWTALGLYVTLPTSEYDPTPLICTYR